MHVWFLHSGFFRNKYQRGLSSRDRIVVSTLRCGRSNPGSNPGHGMDKNFFFSQLCPKCNLKTLRRPGIEPGSTAWKAAMLTIIPPTLQVFRDGIDACIMVTFALIYHR